MGGAVLADMGDDYELVAFNRRPMEGVESIQGFATSPTSTL